MILFHDVRLIDPATRLDQRGSLLVRDGRIAGHGTAIDRPDGCTVVEGDGAILCPGLVDMRVGVGEPGGAYRETVATAARAAAAGGITTIATLPDTTPAIDEPALVRLLVSRGEAAGLNILPYGALTRNCAGVELAEIGLLREAGAVLFGDGSHAVASTRLMRQALLYARTFGARVVVHAEDPSLAEGGCATEGETATRMGLPGIPAEAEAIHLSRDLALARLTGAALHVAHVSTGAAVALIRAAKADGVDVTADTAPPYFDLNETAIGEYRTWCKLSPPLRTEADRLAVLDGLRDGTIDAIASDHQPRGTDDKRQPFAQAAAGGTGLATLLGLTLAHVHNGDLPLIDALALLTARPARLLGTDAGTLAVGAAADLCLFDPERIWRVRAGELPGRAQNTPFDGRALEGRVLGTWCGGVRVLG